MLPITGLLRGESTSDRIPLTKGNAESVFMSWCSTYLSSFRCQLSCPPHNNITIEPIKTEFTTVLRDVNFMYELSFPMSSKSSQLKIHLGLNKWPTFSRYHFQKHFLEEKHFFRFIRYYSSFNWRNFISGGQIDSRSALGQVIAWHHKARNLCLDYNDVIMGAIASQITSLTIVYWTICSDADQRKRQSSVSLAFTGIHRWPVNSPHKGPVTRRMFPFDDVIMGSVISLVNINFTPIYSCEHIMT